MDNDRGLVIGIISFAVWILSVATWFQNANLGYGLWGVSLILLLLAIILYLHDKAEAERMRREAIVRFGAENMDDMTGVEFEELIQVVFTSLGYNVQLTSVTGDYGADLIMRKEGKKIAVQAKRHSKNIGIGAVQQVYTSLTTYDADEGWVITNVWFTRAAINQAKDANVRLVDRDRLIECITLANKSIDQQGESK